MSKAESEQASFPERVAQRATEVQVARLLLSLLAVPFYVLGFVVGVVWLAIRWIYAAVVVGFADARDRQVKRDAG
ncbi:MAG: hypothetical protein AAGA42_14360 [Actinomycetota bacterium]